MWTKYDIGSMQGLRTCVMLRLTVAIFVLTGIVTVATLYNVFWK